MIHVANGPQPVERAFHEQLVIHAKCLAVNSVAEDQVSSDLFKAFLGFARARLKNTIAASIEVIVGINMNLNLSRAVTQQALQIVCLERVNREIWLDNQDLAFRLA